MTRIGFRKNVASAARQASAMGRRTSARVVSHALSHMKRRTAPFQHLVIVPPDLRAADPSFWREVQSGHFGLSGTVAALDGHSPFEVAAPSPGWARELHAFSWLRHLEAADDPAAEAAARAYIEGWVATPAQREKVACLPAVRACRILSWLSHSPFVLDGATGEFFDMFGSALAADVAALAAASLSDTEGVPRLLTATALVFARLAIEGQERLLPRAIDRLDQEIGRQILPDGAHISRNPEVIFELLLDWLPLKSCLESRRIEPSTAFLSALHRQLAMLRFLRLGDGGLARFNGMGGGNPVAVATLLAYDDEPAPRCAVSQPAGYTRLSRADTVVIADTGLAPPLASAAAAHAGCLSIEVSSKGVLLLCNAGAPDPSQARWLAVARATASHSTVSVGETSSSQLVRNARLEALHGSSPLRGPAHVSAELASEAGGATLTASHDGYVGRFNLEHHREITLSADGATLSGRDRLETPRAQDRLKRDIPFAIHFHLHPDTACMREPRTSAWPKDALRITLRDGQMWLFSAPGHKLAIEESLSFTGSSGPRPALQIVVRGSTGGLTEVAWVFMQIGPPQAGSASL